MTAIIKIIAVIFNRAEIKIFAHLSDTGSLHQSANIAQISILTVGVKMILNSGMSFRPTGEIPQTLVLPGSPQGFLDFARNDMCPTSC
jgi:hypothetical protein